MKINVVFSQQRQVASWSVLIANENGRLTFLGEKGMLQHYRRMHGQRFDLNLCKHLFKVKHYEETVEMLKQLSLYRKDSERDLKDFQVKAKSCGDLLLAGKTKREAVKLAALAFKHRKCQTLGIRAFAH